jgi:hypothetical protein
MVMTATMSSPTLSGQVAMPRSVCGVTHGAEQHAHHDEAHARQRKRHPHRPSCQRGHGHRNHRSRNQRAGKSDELQQASPRRGDEQRLGDGHQLELASGFVHIARCSCSPD